MNIFGIILGKFTRKFSSLEDEESYLTQISRQRLRDFRQLVAQIRKVENDNSIATNTGA